MAVSQSLVNADNTTEKNVLIHDKISGKPLSIDNTRALRVAQQKRLIGSNFGNSIDTTYLYTTSVSGTGAVTASNGVGSLTTGTTANSSASLVTKAKARYLSGRQNILRVVARFGDSGVTNNVREFGL